MHTALVFGGRSIPSKTGTLEALGYQLKCMFQFPYINYNAYFRCLILEMIEVTMLYTLIYNYLLKELNLCNIFLYYDMLFSLKSP